ncbi:MAG: presqualene diphosphate synthase HpnD [Gammaproteobacteria bacterium]
MTPERYCLDKGLPQGSSLYYSALYLQPEQRRALAAVFALRREIRALIDECSDLDVAQRKLDWWRAEIEGAFGGAVQHPAAQALQQAAGTFNLPVEYFQEMLDGVEMDLRGSRYETFRDLSLYCHRVGGVAGTLWTEICGYRDHRALKYGHALGVGLELLRILRDLRHDVARGRLYLPREELERFAVTTTDLGHPTGSGHVQALLGLQSRRIHEQFEHALSQLPEVDRFRQCSGLIMCRIQLTLLKEIERDGLRVLEHRLRLTPLRKLWLAWNGRRREKRRLRAA